MVLGYYGQGQMALLEIPCFDPREASSLFPNVDDFSYLWISFPDGCKYAGVRLEDAAA